MGFLNLFLGKKNDPVRPPDKFNARQTARESSQAQENPALFEDSQGARLQRNSPVQYQNFQTDTETAKTVNSLTRINSTEELSTLKWSFEGVLDGFPINAKLMFNVCPVLLGGAKGTPTAKACIFCTEDFAASDTVKSLLEQMRTLQAKSGWTVWSECPVVVCSNTILLSIVRRELSKDRITGTRKAMLDKSTKGAFDGFKSVIKWAIEQNASDVTFQVHDRDEYSQVHFTIYGFYVDPPEFRMPTGTMLAMLNTAYSVREGGKDPVYDPTIEQDCRLNLSIDGVDVLLRWGGIASHYPGPSVTLRIITLSSVKMKTLADLGYLESHRKVLNRATNSEGGAVIFVGVVNSGKTHSIAALLGSLSRNRKKMSLENPVELLIPGVTQKNIVEEYGTALRILKRSSMNDILLGEIRDQVDGKAFMDLASMGGNIYTTTHTHSPIAAYDKLSQDSVGIPRDFLATPRIIKTIVGQSLLAKNCTCALSFSALIRDGAADSGEHGRYLKRIESLYKMENLSERLKFRNLEGCDTCRKSGISALYGFAGRQLVAEMFEPDDIALELIRAGSYVKLSNYVSDQRTAPYDDPDMDGKTAMECAMYWAFQGVIDPREIEPRFWSFEREERLRKSRLPNAFHGANDRRFR